MGLIPLSELIHTPPAPVSFSLKSCGRRWSGALKPSLATLGVSRTERATAQSWTLAKQNLVGAYRGGGTRSCLGIQRRRYRTMCQDVEDLQTMRFLSSLMTSYVRARTLA